MGLNPAVATCHLSIFVEEAGVPDAPPDRPAHGLVRPEYSPGRPVPTGVYTRLVPGWFCYCPVAPGIWSGIDRAVR